MTYQAYQTCALSPSFILRTLNWTFDLPTWHKLTVQHSPSPTNIVAQQKDPFTLPTSHIWLKVIEVLPSIAFKNENQFVVINIYLSTTLYLQWKNGPLPMTMLKRYQTNLTSHQSRNTWWGKGHLSTQQLQEMPASKLRQPKITIIPQSQELQ
jgi:hypothetical protein